MAKMISLDKSAGMIKIHCTGKVSGSELKKISEKVAEASGNKDIRKILLDARDVVSLPDTVDLFQFGASLQNYNAFAGAFFAVVNSPEQQDDVKFLETVARNRGTIMKAFSCMDQALLWLNN